MLSNYLPILILGSIAIVLAILLMTLSKILGPYRPNKIKLDPYESGMDPVGEASDRYSISFYLVAIAFIVFDIEVVFVYPWAVSFLDYEVATLVSMVIFIAELFVGLIYLVKKGMLDWDMKEDGMFN
ncbi:NADH dehydrogenase subunit A [Fodinibius salinus]|uniref:NADH-quinone oxidoreductase subunit A n=1 Tax=Fodinibius salinus TaxID=860790 RepID=A0A5D3YLP2_9BACT|nr:NADH-quinone oxidoreductase subunit A [Fodinibius salinus]TYP95086.1 NADH dehydrogenase subunit A [Fodinibius salinus]